MITRKKTNSPVIVNSLPKLAILAPHPVQYHSPLYREISTSQKVDLTVVYCDKLGLKPRYEKRVNAYIEWDVPLLEGHRYHFLRNLGKPTWRLPFSRINPGILWHLANNRYDVILIQGYLNITDWLALFAARVFGCKLIFRVEANLTTSEAASPNPVKRILTKTMIRAADIILYSCSGNRRWFEFYGAPPEKMRLIPCSVDNDLFRAHHERIKESQLSAKKQAGLKDEIIYVCSVSKMIPRKRLIDIVEAVSIVQQRGLSVGLILVGDGPERGQAAAKIQELSMENVHLAGWATVEKTSAYYAAADILVLASDYDPSPKVVSEALNFGLPVICTKVVGTAGDVIVEGENGFLFPVGDIDALAENISRIILDEELRAKMGCRSLEISDQWSIKAAAESVVQSVDRIMKG